MPVDVQATGFMGIAFETTPGTYAPPTKFFPIRNESFLWTQDTHWRRPIRQVNDILGAVAGNGHCTGDIEVELLEDVLPYFLYASRNTVVKSGVTPNFIYTTTPFHSALPTAGRSLSITIIRAGVVFGYVNCIVGTLRISTDGPIAILNASVVGTAENSQTLPTPSFTTTEPYGAGRYTIEVPTATQVFNIDTFSFEANDNATPEFRLKNAIGAQFTRFGERNLSLSLERDFESRAEYDAFKALTSQSVSLKMSKGANNYVNILMPAAIKDSYDIGGLQSHGDLVRASVTYQGAYNPGTSKSYEIVTGSQENIT